MAVNISRSERSIEMRDCIDREKKDSRNETIHNQVGAGKGLSGALSLSREQGMLTETIEFSGRKTDIKGSKVVRMYENSNLNSNSNDGDQKEITIERRDEFGRILTEKEAFRLLSHKFHGKGPGKKKQEKRMQQYQQELKMKQMKNGDTPLLSGERTRDALAQQKTPFLLLRGNVTPGETRKDEHFLGIKRKPEAGDRGTPKKPK